MNKNSKFKLLILIFILALLPRIIPSSFENLSPDACIYLDIARNIAFNKKFASCLNIYQYWGKNICYPACICTNWLYSIVISPLLWIFKNYRPAIIFNIVLASINIVLIFSYFYKDTNLRINFVTISLLILLYENIFVSIYPWTEQTSLLIFILIIYSLIRGFREDKLMYFLIGGLLGGINFLCRVGSYIYTIGFLVWILCLPKLNIKKRIRYLAIFLVGYSIILVILEGICFYKYGKFYPQYPKSAFNYFIASYFQNSGYYGNSPPYLRSYSSNIINFGYILKNFLHHLFVLIKHLNIMWVSFFLLLLFRPQTTLSKLILIQILTGIIGYAFNFSFSPYILWVDVARYSLIPAVLLCTAWFLLWRKINNKKMRILTTLLLSLCIARNAWYDYKLHNYYLNKRNLTKTTKIENKEKVVFEFLRRITHPQQIVATNYLRKSFLIERPIVSLPPDASFTENNFKKYIKIYDPQYILFVFSYPQDINQIKIILQHNYKVLLWIKPFIIFSKFN